MVNLHRYSEENTLTNLGGKHLVLYGGVGRGGDAGANAASRELGVVNLDTFLWENPAQQKQLTHGGWRSGHTAGLYKLNAVDPQLERTPGFNPRAYKM
jgi:hypothetical protein